MKKHDLHEEEGTAFILEAINIADYVSFPQWRFIMLGPMILYRLTRINLNVTSYFLGNSR